MVPTFNQTRFSIRHQRKDQTLMILDNLFQERVYPDTSKTQPKINLKQDKLKLLNPLKSILQAIEFSIGCNDSRQRATGTRNA